jgi:hypothetical protein
MRIFWIEWKAFPEINLFSCVKKVYLLRAKILHLTVHNNNNNNNGTSVTIISL